MKPGFKLAKDIYWVGKIDNREVPFHRLLLSKGTTYNAYLLKTGKPTIVDTVDMAFGREFAEAVTELIDPLDIQYIIVNHTEPDHSGGLAALASRQRTLRLSALRLPFRKFNKCTSFSIATSS